MTTTTPTASGDKERSGFAAYLVPPPLPGAAFRAISEPPRGGAWVLLEERLAWAKSRLDPYEGDSRLEGSLGRADLYSSMKKYVRATFGGQVVTNAWLKLFEILSERSLVEGALAGPPGAPLLRAFCNAELPGGFISALNHYVRTTHVAARFEWAGSSLDPMAPAATPGTVLDDFYGLRANNPRRWLMDETLWGDLSRPADVLEMARRAREALGEVDLYTADAGIRVSSGCFLRQEELTFRIHLGQVLAGLLCLREGGAFIVKTYTFFRPAGLSLIALCSSLFESFHVTKPATSRPANSEVYLTGAGFKGLPADVRRLLFAALGDPSAASSAFADLADPAFAPVLEALEAAAAAIFIKGQASCLDRVLAGALEPGARAGASTRAPGAAAAQQEWIAKYPPGFLLPRDRLAINAPPDNGACYYRPQRREKRFFWRKR
jgi:hypothetical protein